MKKPTTCAQAGRKGGKSRSKKKLAALAARKNPVIAKLIEQNNCSRQWAYILLKRGK